MGEDWTRPAELAARATVLTDAIRSGRAVPAGRLFGLPELPGDDYWLDMAGTTAITGIPPNTITSWLARGGPTRNPFPAPRRLLYRLYWRGTQVTSWQAREKAAADLRAPARSGQPPPTRKPPQR